MILFGIGVIVVILCLFVACLSIAVLGTRQRVDELEEENRNLSGKLATVQNDLWKNVIIKYPQLNYSQYGPDEEIKVRIVIQMLMNHLGLEIEKTPEKISLVIANAQPQ